MTATHLKRLFAHQDVFGSLDRSATGMSMSEADEKETKDTPTSTEPPTPTFEGTTNTSLQPPRLELTEAEDDATPLAGIHVTVGDPLGQPSASADYDSDSTISALPKDSPRRQNVPLESSGMDSDAQPFVSRLPRRSRPAPRYVTVPGCSHPNSIADMVKRFQESAASVQEWDAMEDTHLTRPRSSASIRRSRRNDDMSDSESAVQARPRMRRGRTEQLPARHRDTLRPGQASDGDRGYAHHAARIPSAAIRRAPPDWESYRPASRVAESIADVNEIVAEKPSLSRSNSGSKSRLAGKGRAARIPDMSPSGRSTPAGYKGIRRAIGGTSRVTSIARHFDRLSREAERERQKRMSAVRGKRARPVGVTKAVVQEFDNVRDAFRDEFDTDSSEADNEEDELGSDDSIDSAGGHKPRSPIKRKLASPGKSAIQTPPLPMPTTSTVDHENPQKSEPLPASGSASSVYGTSVLSDAKSELSFTDRLQIELPTFETSAPLPSVPVTPQLSVDTADESAHPASRLSQMSHLSESELSSGGERSSILKTLTGLWAFRAGDYTPLEYPL